MGFSKEMFMHEREREEFAIPQSTVQTGYEMDYYNSIKPNVKKTVIHIYQIGYPNPAGQFILLSSRTNKDLADKEFRKIYNSKAEYRTGNKVLHMRILEQVVTH